MDIGKYKQAMRPKKYLDGKFVIYDETMPDASDAQLGARDEFAIGGESVIREEFSEGTKTKLVEFVEKFKLENNRVPTIMEIARGAKASTTSVRKYLKEGDDFKVSAYIESGKKAGQASAAKKNTGVFEVDQEAFDDLKKLTKNIKGISIQTTGTKSKSAGLRIGKQYQEIMDQFLGGQPTKYFPANKEG